MEGAVPSKSLNGGSTGPLAHLPMQLLLGSVALGRVD